MKTIDTERLKQLKSGDTDFLLINTLDSEHFDDTKIPGSINVPQSDSNFVQNVESKVSSKSQPVVVYCASKECDSSSKAAQKLEDAGFTEVIDFEGGAQEWKNAGESLAV